ncbi:hypothetical protein WISP_15670 [Willisornis vidua]|uniref:Uncharacterized protein n=1 Tax=Willisornis vidua TaxID=1566151 RepID=A0ABQ9DW22_9PASS|nr:hypothetical protein WISP_15670 [Willisornis vidua]
MPQGHSVSLGCSFKVLAFWDLKGNEKYAFRLNELSAGALAGKRANPDKDGITGTKAVLGDVEVTLSGLKSRTKEWLQLPGRGGRFGLEQWMLTPSAFQKEMSLTTKQRLASTWEMNLLWIVQLLDRSETFHDKFSAVDPDQTLFQPFPSEVVFQNYVPRKVYEMPVVLRNMDKVLGCGDITESWKRREV